MFPATPIGKLTMHLALTTQMIQLGTPASLLKQQLITVRELAKEVLDDDELRGIIHIPQLIPESVAEALAEDTPAPDDLSGL